MTKETRIMMGGYNESPLLFFIPIVLTIIICLRNKVVFLNKNLLIAFLIITIWMFFEIIDKKVSNFDSLKTYLNIYYSLTVGYIHVIVFKDKLFPLYENIIVFLSILSLIFWIPMVIFPDFTMSFVKFLPKTGYGFNFLYLVNIMDVNLGQVTYGVVRNAGCSWEPGRFAIMLCLAILINIYRNGIRFKKNQNIIWLLLTLVTTMSTTGYVLALVIYLYMTFKKINIKNLIYIFVIVIPTYLIFSNLSFLGDKLVDKVDYQKSVDHIEESYIWTDSQTQKGEIAYSMDRFPSFYFEYINFIHDPILGYGANWDDSYFYNHYTSSIGITGGLMSILSRYGLFLGLFVFYILFNSSNKISMVFNSSKKYGFLICFVISMFSYPIIWFPIFTAFWFYGCFVK